MDHLEEITSAIPMVNTSKSMSSQEFQGLLTSWYEEKGVLSELRTQLRHKMINVLRNTAIGRDIARKTSQNSINLSKQAINLIVAEFLMKNKCDYSLSLFNTEAGLSSTFIESVTNETNRISLQFDKENILNILELIGIHRISEICDNVLYMYYQNNDSTSLLSCLISVLSKSVIEKKSKPPDLKYRSNFDLTHETDFIRQIGTFMMESKVPSCNIPTIVQMIKCLHKEEIENIETNYNKTLLKLKKALLLKDKQLTQTDKKKKMVEIKLLKLVGDYGALKMQMKNVIKDRLLKEQEINNLKNSIKNENQNVLETSLEKPTDIICNIDHCDEKCKQNIVMVSQLQNETKELRLKNTKQTEEITELQRKYTDLLHDFNLLQNKVSLLNIKVNEDTPSTNLNLKMVDELRHISKARENTKKRLFRWWPWKIRFSKC